MPRSKEPEASQPAAELPPETHTEAMRTALRNHGDMPRTVEFTLSEDVTACLGIRNFYVTDGTGRVAVIAVHWDE